LPFPFVGGLIAVIFHEFVYKKVAEKISESEAPVEDDGLLDKNEQEE
jgi:hypothetical protein